MREMFKSAEDFNGDISGREVSSVTSMDYMFSSAHAFNSDVSGNELSLTKLWRI